MNRRVLVQYPSVSTPEEQLVRILAHAGSADAQHWTNMAADRLMRFEVVKREGSKWVCGARFGDYLISQNLAQDHMTYLRRIMLNTKDSNWQTPNEVGDELAPRQFRERFNERHMTEEKLMVLMEQVVEIMHWASDQMRNYDQLADVVSENFTILQNMIAENDI